MLVTVFRRGLGRYLPQLSVPTALCRPLRPLSTTSRKDLPFRCRDLNIRFNEEIKASSVVLVYPTASADASTRGGPVNLSFALAEARRLSLDVIEVNRRGPIPVCRLADFRSYAMEEYEKHKPAAKPKSRKEIVIGSKISPNDLETKVNQIRRLLSDRHPILMTVEGKPSVRPKQIDQYRRYLDEAAQDFLRMNRLKGRKGVVLDRSSIPTPPEFVFVRDSLEECTAACYDILTRVQDMLGESLGRKTNVVVSDLKYQMELFPPSSEGKKKPEESSPSESSK